MCGRFTLTPDAERLFEEYGIGVPADYRPRWNVAPGQPILAVAGAEPRAGWLHWGLVPHWSKRKRPFINLRAETLHRTASGLLARHRCVVPADGFYEWQEAAAGKQPFHLRLPGGRLFDMAAVWARGEGDGPPTIALLTTAARGRVRQIHHRMPLLLSREERAEWLAAGPGRIPTGILGATQDDMEISPVSTRVNDVRHDDPACAEPII